MLELLEAPADFITVEEAKSYLRVAPLNERDDVMIASQIKAAIGFLDGPNGYLGAAIASQRWRYRCGAFGTPIYLPLGPVISVEAISYRTDSGTTVVLDADDYYTYSDSMGPMILPTGDWPSDVAPRIGAVTIDYTAGRVAIPEQLRSAALLIVGQLYEHKEIDVDVRISPTSFSMFDLAHPYRASM